MPGLCQVGRRITQLSMLILMIRKTKRFLIINQIQMDSCLRQHLFFHYDATLVIEFALVPEGAVRQMMFTGSSIYCELFCDSFVMSSSLVSARLRGLSFRIWHIRFILTFSIFPIGGLSVPLHLVLQRERSKPAEYHFPQACHP